MTSQSRISVIISTYNRADLLPEAVESLLGQTRVPDEIVVVDDGSTDHTPRLMAGYGPPVISIRQENRGLAAGRNSGLRAATGDYVAFLDSDDWLAPGSIEKRAAILDQNPDVDVVYSDIMMTDEAGTPLACFTEVRPGPRPSGDAFLHYAEYNLMPVHGYMVRRRCFDIAGLFNEELAALEDYDLWLRMAAAHLQFRYLNEPLGFYRTHGGMMTVERREQMMRINIEVHTRQVVEAGLLDGLTARQRSRLYVAHGKLHGFVGQMAEARRWFGRGIAAAPWTPRPWAYWLLALLGKATFDRALAGYGKLRDDNPLLTEITG